MIIDLSNYRLKEDICAASDDSGSTSVIKMSDIIIGGKNINNFMARTTEGEAEYNSLDTPGVQYCRYYLLPEEIGLTSYYEIYRVLLTAFGTTEEELLANGGEMTFPISSIKLGNTVFNANRVYIDIAARHLNIGVEGQTFTILLELNFINPNLVGVSEEGFNEFFKVDIIR